jgi:hypothetical protein
MIAQTTEVALAECVLAILDGQETIALRVSKTLLLIPQLLEAWVIFR